VEDLAGSRLGQSIEQHRVGGFSVAVVVERGRRPAARSGGRRARGTMHRSRGASWDVPYG
jgi:hypothetical protein